MPLLTVKVAGDNDAELTANIAKHLLQLTADILKKDPKLTAINIEYLPLSQWFIAGKSLLNLNKRSFSLEIKITDETNTKAEKADYIAAVYQLFSSLFENLAEESYIYINDVRATAYGYGGLTQEARYHNKGDY